MNSSPFVMEGENHITRQQKILEDNLHHDYVPTDGIQNICDFLERASFATPTRGGLEPLRPSDIIGWCTILEMELDADEARMVMGLSRIFINEHDSYDRNNRARKSPYALYLAGLKKKEMEAENG